ncbi:MAG: sensor domain-containing protein [Bacillota bacterium]
MSKPLPRSIQEYLDQLHAELQGADPALIQDALYDAEEYIRGEMDSNRGKTEEQVLAAIAASYGAPEEVAEAYRNTEAKVQQALRTPRPKKRETALGKFFGVYADPRAYTSLFYMLLAFVTGIFYLTWTVAGLGMSAGFMVLIIGIPFLLVYLGSTRLISFIEGRIVEVMLGVRMPRRPVHPGGGSRPMKQRIIEIFTDRRTWSTFLYMLLQFGLGTLYFCVIVTWASLALSMILAPFEFWLPNEIWFSIDGVSFHNVPWYVTPFMSALGVILLTGLLHFAKGVGWLHGHLAKHLLVMAD